MEKVTITKDLILKRLKYFRNKKHITAYQVSKELGHAKSLYYRLESGETKLTMETFLEILDILEVTPLEFFYPNLMDYELDLKVFDIIQDMTPEKKKQFLETASFLKK